MLGLWGRLWCQVCRDTDCLHSRNYGLIRVFPGASCSWKSEDLFSQSFSVAPPIWVLRGLPCLGSFSVVWSIRHIEGAHLTGLLLYRSAHQALKAAPWVGSYFVVWHINHLKDGVLLCSSVHQVFDGPDSLLFSC